MLPMTSPHFSIGCIPGDGVGSEVTAEACRALSTVGELYDLRLEFTDYDLGSSRYLASGEVLPDSAKEELSEHDAILLGAIGTPEVPPGILERGLLLRLRFEFDLFVNLRPIRLYPGVPSPVSVTPDQVDLLVVRENTEGPYAGAGGNLRHGTPQEVAIEESINTRWGVERLVRYGFEQAVHRSQRLTLCHKTNVLTFAGGLWQRTVEEVAREFPQVSLDYTHVDAVCLYLVTQPERFDVVVTDNLFGDIVTDLGAALQGGMGLAASANLNPTGAYPSMFEPVHGSAPDIAGQGRANPVAAVLSAALMLEQLNLGAAADSLEQATVSVLSDLPASVGPENGWSTRQIGEQICQRVASPPAST